MANHTEPPQYFICPITHDIMTDPWMDRDGISYEYEAIKRWLTINSISPVTKKALTVDQLVINRSLKAAIETYLATNDILNEETNNSLNNYIKPKPTIKFNAYTKNKVALEIDIKNNLQNYELDYVPTDIVFCVDLSYSMEEKASKTSVENGVYTILSLVKHSLKTIVSSLNKSCRIAIVTFSNSAELRFRPLYMTEENKQKAILCIENMKVISGTNLWTGIDRSFKTVDEFNLTNNPTIYTFTDGVSNDNPPSGLINKVMTTNKIFPNYDNVVMNVFGFGSNLATDDLNIIANHFHGTFNYICDNTMVGTVFINATTNTLLSSYTNTVLEFSTFHPIKKIYCPNMYDPSGSLSSPTSRDNYKIITNNIMYNQTKSFIIEFSDDIDLEQATEFIYKDTIKFTANNTPVECNIENINGGHILQLNDAVLKFQTIKKYTEIECINKLWDCLDSFNMSNNHAAHYEKCLELSKLFTTHEYYDCIKQGDIHSNIITDLETEILMAVSDKQTFYDWGKKYIYAYRHALMFQQCNNFKDKIGNCFGNTFTHALKTKLEDIFVTIPGPKPIPVVKRDYRTNTTTSYIPTMTQEAFRNTSYNSSGACFSENTMIIKLGYGCSYGNPEPVVPNDPNILCKNVNPGDYLLTYDNSKDKYEWSKVVYIITSKYNGIVYNYKNSAELTPYHPILTINKNNYIFPIDDNRLFPTNYKGLVYNFVMENRGSLVLGNKNGNVLYGITLGHGITIDPVANHDYYGSDKIIDDIKQYKDINNIYEYKIHIRKFTRCPTTNLINGIDFTSE